MRKASKSMDTAEKGKLIASIMIKLKEEAYLQSKNFNEGIFFDLIFKTDSELFKIKSLCGL